MSSDSETQFDISLTKAECNRASFVYALKKNSIVLNRSLASTIVAAKEKAWSDIKSDYEKSIGETVPLEKLKRILNNLKTEMKKKIDKKATGNKSINIKTWEKDFIDLLEKYENPTINKVPGALTVGIISKEKRRETSTERSPSTSTSTESTSELTETGKAIPKRKRNSFETDETAALSTTDLQRLVLIEQLELIRTQKKEADLKLQLLKNEIKKQSAPEDEEGRFSLTDYLVLH